MKSAMWIAAVLFAAPALAQDAGCKHTATQEELNLCAGKDFGAADKDLNALYASLMSKYEPQSRNLLREAERKWIAYRDAECAFETAQTADGSIHSQVYSACLTTKTKARIKELEAQRDCEEGDLSCNNP